VYSRIGNKPEDEITILWSLINTFSLQRTALNYINVQLVDSTRGVKIELEKSQTCTMISDW